MVQVKADDLQIQLWVCLVPIYARHEEIVQVHCVEIHLRTIRNRIGASARVLLVVVIPIHAVPRHRAQQRVVPVPPLCVPLRIVLAVDTVGVERIPDVQNELHIAQALELLEHAFADADLAIRTAHIAVQALVPTPIADHQEGAFALLRRSRGGGGRHCRRRDIDERLHIRGNRGCRLRCRHLHHQGLHVRGGRGVVGAIITTTSPAACRLWARRARPVWVQVPALACGRIGILTVVLVEPSAGILRVEQFRRIQLPVHVRRVRPTAGKNGGRRHDGRQASDGPSQAARGAPRCALGHRLLLEKPRLFVLAGRSDVRHGDS
mmetsp:Transcript_120253/g.345690  ORF Transcript_120253/g.345690 Transcript_120253/m.345690 type:complete len:321 (+) Transcript_120253:789-1751(+)